MRTNLAEIFQSQQLLEVDLQSMEKLMMIFTNKTIDDNPLVSPIRYQRNNSGAVEGSVLGTELNGVFV